MSRSRDHGSLAMFAGVAPVPASSGQARRVRYNRRGNRRLNHAVWTVAVWQAKFHPAAREYLARRKADGKSLRERLRCLKRHLVRAIYAALVAGAPGLQTAP